MVYRFKASFLLPVVIVFPRKFLGKGKASLPLSGTDMQFAAKAELREFLQFQMNTNKFANTNNEH